MIRTLDAATERFLDSLRSLNTRLERAQRQMASGKRVETPSDAPHSVASLMQAHADLSRLDQTNANLGRVQTEVDAAEGAMQNAVKLFDRLRTLGMTGASGVHTAVTRQGIAEEVGSILERLVGLANTEVDGRFIFAGDGDQAPAYSADLNQNPPWSSYQGLAATRRAMHPTGITFAVAKNASDIFDDPNGNSTFQAVENLRQALLANDDSSIQAALAPLSDVSAHLNSMLTFYGNVQSQLDEATDTGARLKLRLETQVSGIEDADVTETIVELQQARFNQEAALQMRASIPKTSLFDYLG